MYVFLCFYQYLDMEFQLDIIEYYPRSVIVQSEGGVVTNCKGVNNHSRSACIKMGSLPSFLKV